MAASLLRGKGVFIVAAKRTAFGTFGGKLKGLSATDLAVASSKATLDAAGVDPAAVDASIFGNVMQTSIDAAYLARHVGLHSGLPEHSSALTLNRLCGSGFQSIVSAAESILLGDNQMVLVGGTESMSQAPLMTFGHEVRFGHKLGVDIKLRDALWSALTDTYTGLPMGITAEKLAEKYNISREDADEYGLRSQHAWGKAKEAGVFDAEIAPVDVKGRKGPESFAVDEHPRPDATSEGMAKLPSVFQKNGTVTAGNASGICDGAASLLIASEDACRQHNLKPLARLVSWGISGVDPSIMGIGPCPAIRSALDRADLTLDDMQQVEINEAFASQYLACERELGLDRSVTNRNGGAIALGHPLGASGARIMAHLSHQLHANDIQRAIGAACIGGGQGIALTVERV